MDYSRNVKILVWQGFLIGFSLWAPIAAIYFSQVSGSFALGMSVFSIAMVASAIFEVPTGIFSDLIGRKYTTMLGGFFYTIAYMFYALAASYPLLVVGAICEGIARSFYSGNNDALLYDSLKKSDKKDDLEKWMGHIGGAEQWALGIAAVIGGVIASVSFKTAIWLSVIPVFMCFVTSWWLIEVKDESKGEGNVYHHLKEAWKNFVSNEKLRLISLADITGFGLGEVAFQFRSVFVASIWPIWAIGASQMLANIGAAIGFNLSGKIVKKLRPERVLLWGGLYSRFADFIALLSPSVLSPALMATTSITYGPGTVAKNSLFQKEFGDKQRATMGSLNSLGRSLFFGVAAVITGVMADSLSPRVSLIWNRIVSLIVIYLSWKLVTLIKAEKQA